MKIRPSIRMNAEHRRVLLTLWILIAIGVPELVRAQGPSAPEAARQQTVVSGGMSSSADLLTVRVGWPFDVQSEICAGDQTDYFVVVRDQHTDGGNQTASISMFVRRANIGGGTGTINGIFSRCERCAVDKMGFHGEYSGDSSATINFDDVNSRWGLYVDDIPVRIIPGTDAKLQTANLVKIGGNSLTQNSIVGPFAHEASGIRRQSSGAWSTFSPSNTAEFLVHPPPANRYHSFYSGIGSLLVFTVGSASCS